MTRCRVVVCCRPVFLMNDELQINDNLRSDGQLQPSVPDDELLIDDNLHSDDELQRTIPSVYTCTLTNLVFLVCTFIDS